MASENAFTRRPTTRIAAHSTTASHAPAMRVRRDREDVTSTAARRQPGVLGCSKHRQECGCKRKRRWPDSAAAKARATVHHPRDRRTSCLGAPTTSDCGAADRSHERTSDPRRNARDDLQARRVRRAQLWTSAHVRITRQDRRWGEVPPRNEIRCAATECAHVWHFSSIANSRSCGLRLCGTIPRCHCCEHLRFCSRQERCSMEPSRPMHRLPRMQRPCRRQ